MRFADVIEGGICLGRYVHSSIWDVKVPNDEDEAGSHVCSGVCEVRCYSPGMDFQCLCFLGKWWPRSFDRYDTPFVGCGARLLEMVVVNL